MPPIIETEKGQKKRLAKKDYVPAGQSGLGTVYKVKAKGAPSIGDVDDVEKHEATQKMMKPSHKQSSDMPKYKKGGKVKKTGPAIVHKGEHVLTKKQAAKPAIKKAIKKG